MMRVSLNEIQTVIFKACIAVGLPTGISQDAGQAARHVYPQYMGSMLPFSDAITAVDRKCSNKFNIPQAVEGTFKSNEFNTKLSSLYTAPAVCDQIIVNNKHNPDHSPIILLDLDVPTIIIFEIMLITKYLNNDICVIWSIDQGNNIQGVCRNGNNTFIYGNHNKLFSIRNSTLTINVIKFTSKPNNLVEDNASCLTNFNVDKTIWKLLSDYAERLLVPSTDTSRKSGAGAGTIDTD